MESFGPTIVVVNLEKTTGSDVIGVVWFAHLVAGAATKAMAYRVQLDALN